MYARVEIGFDFCFRTCYYISYYVIVFIRRIDNVDVRKRFDFIELTYDISVDVICLRSNADAFAYVDYDVSDNRAFAFAFSENRTCSAVVVRRAVT